ncbi:hypothetical protein M378DRAFT_171908 [Amanita muscaria Koide BX008]|uniref:Uncharacterized protein n=1 Tax=Amanita muscaria (strain Koide BX008) TaxID=946122 RepID=A0A0C2S3Q4_AMAMK|nr:hypothetical protein M378DRAFT_171908 [Amanita muscaria Koide BX008]
MALSDPTLTQSPSLIQACVEKTYCPHTATYINAVGAFFSTSTREGINDSRPPSYAETLPEYSSSSEPETLAVYLFKFGFLFPPFWILGAVILISPLRAPEPKEASPSWLPEESHEKRQYITIEMRRVEVKWAKRCLWALITLTVMGIITGVAIWAALKR